MNEHIFISGDLNTEYTNRSLHKVVPAHDLRWISAASVSNVVPVSLTNGEDPYYPCVETSDRVNETKEQRSYHVDLEVDGQANVVRHVVLSHVHDVVPLIGDALGRPVFARRGHAASRQSAETKKPQTRQQLDVTARGLQGPDGGRDASPLPRQHGRVFVVGLLPLLVLAHGRSDLALDFEEIVHGVEGQLDVASLQAHQVVRLRGAGSLNVTQLASRT